MTTMILLAVEDALIPAVLTALSQIPGVAASLEGTDNEDESCGDCPACTEIRTRHEMN